MTEDERIQMQEPPKCRNCEEPLTEVWGKDEYHIVWRDGQYVKEEAPSKLICGKCSDEIDDDDAEPILRAVGLL